MSDGLWLPTWPVAVTLWKARCLVNDIFHITSLPTFLVEGVAGRKH